MKYISFVGLFLLATSANALEWHLEKINASEAWQTNKGDGVSIAVVDRSDTPHGTIVSNTARSVAPGALIVRQYISGKNLAKSISNAVRTAASNGHRIINVSYIPSDNREIVSAATYARSLNCLVFWSGGNSGITTDPVKYIVHVASTDSNDMTPGWASHGEHIDVSAPGASVLGYSGGSIASPVAAGVAALIMSANPSLNANQVEDILKESSIDLGTPGKDIYYGYGRVDAGAAVQLAKITAGEILPPIVTNNKPPRGKKNKNRTR